ncbi:MAG: ECF-type sigma factor [Acidobacteriota bacterium]
MTGPDSGVEGSDNKISDHLTSDDPRARDVGPQNVAAPAGGLNPENGSGDVTSLLREWSGGDPDALDKLIPLVMDEVRALARKALSSESRELTIQPTELVSEAYIRLVKRETYWWRDRVQFFSSLAELMRRILVDRARRHLACKRGGGALRVNLEEGIFAMPHDDAALVALDDALEDLRQIDERKYRIVMLWFFVGMTQQEIAEDLSISVNTVARHWQAARGWLYGELKASDRADENPGDRASRS